MAPHSEVTFDTKVVIYPVTPNGDSPPLPATPEEDGVHDHYAQVPRTHPGIRDDIHAYQSMGMHATGGVPAPGHYALRAGSGYPPFHASHVAGSATQYAAFGDHHHQHAAGYGAASGLVGAQDLGVGGASHGYGMPTVAASPKTPAGPLMQTMPLPSTPSQGSPQGSPPGSPRDRSPSSSWGTPSPEPPKARRGSSSASDLSHYLEHFELIWDLRGMKLKDLGQHGWFGKRAFLSGRKKCEITFRVANDDWKLKVDGREGNPLTVMDVLAAIDKHVWAVADSRELYVGHPRYDDALAERSYRIGGDQDGLSNTLKNVDFISEDSSCFLGLCEVDGRPGVILACLGPSPSK